MPNFVTACVKSLSHVLFPPLCMTCGETLSEEFTTLCATCMRGLALVEEEGRCARCFCVKEKHEACLSCKALPRSLRQQAFCFASSPVSNQLLSLLRNGIAFQAAASYMALQLTTLRWPMPDLIVPTPSDWFDAENGGRVRKCLAKEVAGILHRPYTNCIQLQRHLLPIRHESLELQPTFTEALLSFFEPTNKVVLLIHDTFTTGRALTLSAKALVNVGAHSVYGLSLVSDSVA